MTTTLRVRTGVKAGSSDNRIALNHSEPVLRVRTAVKAGGDRIAVNHSEPALGVRTAAEVGRFTTRPGRR